ncbi:MAG: hypothetical protein KDE53_23375 [Caldilineaceae bacterium]|nr:hypothetical protein [Caldilineaceae bacterium]
MVTLDQAINTVLALPPQQQEMLLEIVYRRQVAARRQEIAQDAQHSLAAYRAGQLAPQPLEEILAELHAGLDDEDEDITSHQ